MSSPRRPSLEGTSPEAKPARKRSLSKQALKEHEQQDNPRRTRKDSMPPRGRRDTDVSAVTDLSLDDESSRGRSVSLYGLSLTMRAMKITRRLSVSSYMKTGLEPVIKAPTVQYENTYRMEPEEGTTFKYSDTERIMKKVLERYLANTSYNQPECKSLCSAVSNGILARAKEFDMPRYKFICHVMIGQKKDQGVTIAARCLWSAETDNYVTVTYENPTLYAVATLYALYFE